MELSQGDVELIRESHEQGVNVGQIALAEYLLKSYEDDMSPQMRRFLHRVASDSYEGAAKNLNIPAEDVALKVKRIMDKAVG